MAAAGTRELDPGGPVGGSSAKLRARAGVWRLALVLALLSGCGPQRPAPVALPCEELAAPTHHEFEEVSTTWKVVGDLFVEAGGGPLACGPDQVRPRCEVIGPAAVLASKGADRRYFRIPAGRVAVLGNGAERRPACELLPVAGGGGRGSPPAP